MCLESSVSDLNMRRTQLDLVGLCLGATLLDCIERISMVLPDINSQKSVPCYIYNIQ
jgi:hypothetical protein